MILDKLFNSLRKPAEELLQKTSTVSDRYNIAIISDRAYPYFKGGAEKRYWEIAKNLLSMGFEVTFFTGQWPGMLKREVIDGINLIGVYKVRNFYENGRKSIIESIKYTLSIIKFLLKENYDLIECEQFPLLPLLPVKVISLLRNKPLVVTWHEVWGIELWLKYLGKLGIVGEIIERIVVSFADQIISVSCQTTENLINLYKIPRTKIITLPNGIDLNWDRRASHDHTEMILSNNCGNTSEFMDKRIPVEFSDVIYVGRLLAHKNVDFLLNVISHLKMRHDDIKCLIIGDGPERGHLDEIVRELNIMDNVHFLGNIENEKRVYSYMKNSRVFVSLSVREGFGITILEANACGLPAIVIQHDDNASCGLIQNGVNGYISDLDLEKIVDLITNILDSTQNKYIKECYIAAQNYSWVEISKHVKAIYTEFLRVKNPSNTFGYIEDLENPVYLSNITPNIK